MSDSYILLSFTRTFVVFCSKEIPLPLSAWERLHNVIVALPVLSILVSIFYIHEIGKSNMAINQ